jgi:hypothetical protein
MIETSRLTPKRIIPGILRRLKEYKYLFEWKFSKQGKLNREKLLSQKNKYEGKRLFLIANGPSLKDMDLSVLKDSYTMCMNRFYISFDKIGFIPNFLVCIEDTVLEQFKDDFSSLPCETFFNWRYHDKISNATFLKEAFPINTFFQDNILEPTHFGGTVTYACLQLAYFMGFKEVIIIGMDHSFKEKGTPSTIEVRTYEKDESHFDPNYFPKGMKWKLPDLEKSELSYSTAKKFYHENGRKIIDATINGKCEIFEKEDFYKIKVK